MVLDSRLKDGGDCPGLGVRAAVLYLGFSLVRGIWHLALVVMYLPTHLSCDLGGAREGNGGGGGGGRSGTNERDEDRGRGSGVGQRGG